MKRAVKYAVILVAAVLVVELATCLYRRAYASEIAFQMVLDDCKRQGCDARLLTGPTDGRVGNAAASFSWDYHDTTHHYEYLVLFSRFYEPELARWDYDRKD